MFHGDLLWAATPVFLNCGYYQVVFLVDFMIPWGHHALAYSPVGQTLLRDPFQGVSLLQESRVYHDPLAARPICYQLSYSGMDQYRKYLLESQIAKMCMLDYLK